MLRVLCCFKSIEKDSPNLKELESLASTTAFTLNQVEALHKLYEQLSRSVINDGKIHKEEFLMALFNSRSKKNLLAEKLFELFDLKRNGVIEFGEFVYSLNIFHPDTPKADKIAFAFKLYDVLHTGYIEREGLKKMVLAAVGDCDLQLSEAEIDVLIERTMQESDLKREGKIDIEEWNLLVAKYPSLISNMTVPHLRDITMIFPGFVVDSKVKDSDLVS